MILFLTYHRICRTEQASRRDFYTVLEADLASQLKALRSSQFRPMDAVKPEAALPNEASSSYALSFDDGTADHFEIAAPLLRQTGTKAIFFVPTAKLNRPGYLTDEQLRDLAREGHVIGCHSHEHKRLDLLSREAMEYQIRTSLDLLSERTGVRPTWFAPPGGFVNEGLREVARACGLKAIRTMKWGFNRTIDPFSLECIPINRHVSDHQFMKILEGRDSRWLKSLYAGKELLKRCLPQEGYAKLRDTLLRAPSGH